MRRKLIFGLILFGIGILLQEISYVVDVWIIRVLGGILWPVGMVMVINASISLDSKKQSNNSPQLSPNEESEQKESDETNNY